MEVGAAVVIRESTRKARKVHYCSRCNTPIPVGALHLESVASPNHDDLGNTTWWRMRECARCAELCGRPIDETRIKETK